MWSTSDPTNISQRNNKSLNSGAACEDVYQHGIGRSIRSRESQSLEIPRLVKTYLNCRESSLLFRNFNKWVSDLQMPNHFIALWYEWSINTTSFDKIYQLLSWWNSVLTLSNMDGWKLHWIRGQKTTVCFRRMNWPEPHSPPLCTERRPDQGCQINFHSLKNLFIWFQNSFVRKYGEKVLLIRSQSVQYVLNGLVQMNNRDASLGHLRLLLHSFYLTSHNSATPRKIQWSGSTALRSIRGNM